jgi:hypothetical protein
MKNKPYQIFTARFIGVHAAGGIALVLVSDRYRETRRYSAKQAPQRHGEINNTHAAMPSAPQLSLCH